MRVIEAQDYKLVYPETFNWGLLDSPKLASVASTIRSAIEHDLRTPDRALTPGLRAALNYIADIAEF